MVPNFYIKSKSWELAAVESCECPHQICQRSIYCWQLSVQLLKREGKPGVHGDRLSVTASLALMKAHLLLPNTTQVLINA